jgi:hypothetical protein
MRCRDSAMFSQEPESGVYSGMPPCWNNHRTIDQLVCPARLSQTSRSRSGGSGSRGAWPRQVSHWHRGGRSSAGGAGGSPARPCASSPWSQGCRTVFGTFVVPFARTSPDAGRNRVSSLTVPPRTYSCGWRTGVPTGCQLAPACGIAWYGPASS